MVSFTHVWLACVIFLLIFGLVFGVEELFRCSVFCLCDRWWFIQPTISRPLPKDGTLTSRVCF